MKLQSAIQGVGVSIGLNQLAQAQKAGFEHLKATMAKGFAQIASVIEWGVGELSWQLQQQTEAIKSIDATLKTPSRRRQMSVELLPMNFIVVANRKKR